MSVQEIPLHKFCLMGNELKYAVDVASAGSISGPGYYTRKCEHLFESLMRGSRAFLTPSCSAALELAAMACNICDGDEIILPSFTHPATANAFLARGARPVFVDICADTCNIDHNLIEAAITKKTKVIVPVHYAGVACAMNQILAVADRRDIIVVEDAAHSIDAHYFSKPLGSLGHFGAFSFHGTKNISSGEGGALIVREPAITPEIEMIREHGTNRQNFIRGEADSYSWTRLGGSFLMSELSAAFLYGQLEGLGTVTAERVKAFNQYLEALEPLAAADLIRLPYVPPECSQNGHIFYAICRVPGTRDRLIEHLQNHGIGATFHYLPLHLSKQGKTYGYQPGTLPVTEAVSDNLFRLPLFFGISDEQITRVVSAVFQFFGMAHHP